LKNIKYFGWAFLVIGAVWAYQKYVFGKNISISIADISLNGTLGNQSLTITLGVTNPTVIGAEFSSFYGSVYDSSKNKVIDLRAVGNYTIPANGYQKIPVTGDANFINLLNSANDLLQSSNQIYTLVGQAVIDGISVPVTAELFSASDVKNLLQI